MLVSPAEIYRSIGGVRDLRNGRALVLTIHRASGWCYVDGAPVEGLILLYDGLVAMLRTATRRSFICARHYWRVRHGDLAA